MRSLILCLLFALPLAGDYRQFTAVPPDQALEAKLRAAADATHAAYPALGREDLAFSVVDLTDPAHPVRGDHHGNAAFYPASVIKLFFLADVFATRKQDVGDVRRAMKEMIVVSDNDATAYLVDILADTVPGPPLEGRTLEQYIARRRAINRRFEKLGYLGNVSAMMKAWSFAPYGVDLQVLGKDRVNRNKLTANATAALLLSIVRANAPGAADMLKLLERPIDVDGGEGNQVKEFIGETLPSGSKLWSKAGWTSEVRHDAAYVEFPGGRKLILVVFTRGLGNDVTIVPGATKHLLAAIGVR